MTNDEQTIRGKLFIRGKIKSKKLIFWKDEREIEGEGDGELVDDSLVENFIDSFIHGGGGEEATVTCCTNRATRMLLLLSRKRVAFRPVLRWLKAHPFRWHFPQISIETGFHRNKVISNYAPYLSTQFLYDQLNYFQLIVMELDQLYLFFPFLSYSFVE